jgi:uncharacterized protein YfeS
MSDHDPFNEPETAHPRARELMTEECFWDCTDEIAPFGSDEGFDAYYEWRSWREENPEAPLIECLDWIMSGRLQEFNESLLAEDRLEEDVDDPDSAFLSEDYDVFTLDATVIATALGQLLDEGRIDADAKKYVLVAIKRQSHPLHGGVSDRLDVLNAVNRVALLA